MSVMTAILTSTVSLVLRSSRSGVLFAAALTLGAAEGAVRLLAPRERPPEPASVELGEYFSPEEIARGRAFARPQLVLGLTRSAIEAAVVLCLARQPPRRLDRLPSPTAGGGVAGAGLALALAVAPLPISVIGRRRALAAGLATQSWSGWAGDWIKGTAISAGFGAGAGAAALATIGRWPDRWWLPAAAGSVALGAVMAGIAPLLLDPIFNDFTPLAEGETRQDVLALAQAAGVRVREVYSVDASRRTTAANAYVSGLGPTKRVVLFDTLLDRYSRSEIRVVVAHELAHVRGRDVPRGLLFGAILAAPAALAVQRLAERLGASPPLPSALPGLSLAAGTVTAPVGLIANRLSRMLERRADAFSLKLTADPEAFISFERAIALQNLADLDPPRWLTALLSTHPSTAQRIGLARSLAQPGGPGRVRP